MLALQSQVARTWLATFDNDSSMCRVHGLELDLEPVAVELAFALVAIRVLDRQVFDDSFGTAYQAHRAECREGRVVDGLTLIRNAEVHCADVLDPGVDRVLSIPPFPVGQAWPGTGEFRLLPSWREFDELPLDVRETRRTASRCKVSYREHVAGDLVMDTLQDAVKFFCECDPSMPSTDDEGELCHFPLPELLPVAGERLHPLGSQNEPRLSIEQSVGTLRSVRRR
jgi:hypothetical protein